MEIAYVSKPSNLELVLKKIKQASVIGIDTETTGLDPLTDRLVLIQLATVSETFVLDMYKLPKPLVQELMEEVLHTRNQIKVFHNAKFDLQFFQTEFGFGLNTVNVFDTMLAYALIQGGDNTYKHGLDAVALDVLRVSLDKGLQKSGWGKGQIYKEQIQYAGLDAYILIPLYQKLAEGLRQNALLRVAKLEFDCIPAIASMELNGIKIDTEMWRDIALHDKDTQYELETQTKKAFGVKDMNLNSYTQVCKVLSEYAGVEITSVAKDAVQFMIDNYESKKDLFGYVRDIRPLLIKYQQWNAFSMAQKTFGLSFLKWVHKKTGRIHPNFRQLFPNTGRLSCGSPNIQQIPKDSRHRGAFIAEDGYKLITLDYSQIELRILADITQEDSLLEAFRSGRDVHTEVACRITGKRAKDITKEERDFAKIINYGTPYGMGIARMANLLKVSFDEAKATKKQYMQTHPKIAEWFRAQEAYFKQYHCVRTASGRLRKLNQWFVSDDFTFAATQASKNFPIQGTNADIMKTALTNLYRELPFDAKIVNCVHDEVVIECKEEIAEAVAKEVTDIMVKSGKEFVASVPILVDGKVSDNWTK